MKILLDTHALLWWLAADERLGRRARETIADRGNDILISVVSLWEIVVKIRIGKLAVNLDAVEKVLARDEFRRLGITSTHLRALATLPTHHRDPFDHLIIAQAKIEDAVLMSDDRWAPLYPVTVIPCAQS